jgi:DNA-binding LytR/AlgR family response regulator
MKIPLITSEGKPVWVDASKIIATESINNELTFYSYDDQFTTPKNLNEWESLLAHDGFVQASRSVVVNSTLVQKYDEKKKFIEFDTIRGIKGIKVSRSNVKKIEEVL